jgi:hypothetical protein
VAASVVARPGEQDRRRHEAGRIPPTVVRAVRTSR